MTSQIFMYKDTPQWLLWNSDVDVIRAPVAGDVLNRIYYTGDHAVAATAYPKVSDQVRIGSEPVGPPAAYLRIGVPAPVEYDLTWNNNQYQHDSIAGVMAIASSPNIASVGDSDVTQIILVELLTGAVPNKFVARVTVDTDEELPSPGDYVTFDYPGFDSTPYKVVPSNANDPVNTFRITPPGPLKSYAWTQFIQTTGDPLILVIKNHGMSDGDKVVLQQLPVVLRSDPAYAHQVRFTVEVVNANRIKLLEVIGVQNNTVTWATADPANWRKPGGNTVWRVGRNNYQPVMADDETDYGVANTIFNGVAIKRQWLFYWHVDPDLAKHSNSVWRTSSIETLRQRRYVCTFINLYGEEGPPSVPSDPIIVSPTASVQIGPSATRTAMPLPMHPVMVGGEVMVDAGGYPMYYNAASEYGMLDTTSLAGVVEVTPPEVRPPKWRLYRTDENGLFRFVDDIAYDNDGQITYTDNIPDERLGEVCPSVEWYPPPDEAYVSGPLLGLTSLPNGIACGFTGKEVFLSEPFRPHAYPPGYSLKCDYDVVGLLSTTAGVSVLTTGLPYLITGMTPGNMQLFKLDAHFPCVAKRSIVDMGDYGIYATSDGLVSISGATINLATQQMVMRDQFEAYNPTTFIASHYEGIYFAWYTDPDTDLPTGGVLLDTRNGNFTRITVPAIACYNDLMTDTLYYLSPDMIIWAWDRGDTLLQYRWVSKMYTLSKPGNFGAAQVHAIDYSLPIQFNLYSDEGRLRFSKRVTSEEPFRLPSGFMSDRYKIELIGTATIRRVVLASTISEIRQA